ncbi:MAG: lysophospholipid acyltransferase family protein [Opitutaceae bacterium]|jgi:1-acyl-sn-glycerol-3-phosphate acyltransferase
MKARIKRGFYAACYILSWGWFAAVGLALNVVCTPLLLVPARSWIGIRVRRAIRLLFKLWLCWFHACGMIRLTWTGFDEPLPAGTVYIANHPTILDATFILAKLPDAICVMKASLMRNPAIAPAAILAGYVVSGKPVDAVRDAAAKVAAGRSLLLFPEGTRTPAGTRLGPLKPAFFLCAERAKAPIQLIVVRAPADLAPKGRAWWRWPSELPSLVTLTLDRRWEWDARRSSAELIAEIESRIVSVIGRT